MTVEALKMLPLEVKVMVANHFRAYLLGSIAEDPVQRPDSWRLLLLICSRQVQPPLTAEELRLPALSCGMSARCPSLRLRRHSPSPAASPRRRSTPATPRRRGPTEGFLARCRRQITAGFSMENAWLQSKRKIL